MTNVSITKSNFLLKGRVVVLPRMEYFLSSWPNKHNLTAFVGNAIPWLANKTSDDIILATDMDQQVRFKT